MAPPQEGLCVCTPQETARADLGHQRVTAKTPLPCPPVPSARTSFLLLLTIFSVTYPSPDIFLVIKVYPLGLARG